MLKKIPIGLQDFRKIIENGFLYVDKTAYIYEIVSKPGTYFLSRPRRFGKSVTLSLLHALYNGSRNLFKGLWIEDKWDWNKKHPVLHFSLTSIGFQSIGLLPALLQEISIQARNHGISLSAEGLAPRFRELIGALATDKYKTVVLVDEYDAPLIHYLGTHISQAIANREILREFYSVLKDADASLELVFLTGVSRFSKTGIFSGLNNLDDLSMHPAFATMLGYTQEELETNFIGEIDTASTLLAMPRPILLDKLKEWYNGYRFEENAEKVYNPVSVNHFFSRNKFQNFWFSTGTPSFLIHLLKKEGIYDLHLPAIHLNALETFELENLNIESILYQTGYLTIQHVTNDGFFQLAYPNKEVKDAMLEVLMAGFLDINVERSGNPASRLQKAFHENNLDNVMELLQGVFANLPFYLHEKFPEKFFHAAIHLLFTYMGVRIQSEVCTADGRIDSLVETNSHVYIIEYKLDKSPGEAIAQIRTKKYYQYAWHLGKPVIAVGVQLSGKTKNIIAWQALQM